jgi:hypothetical protein
MHSALSTGWAAVIPPELLAVPLVWAFASALVREVGLMYFLVVLVVLASMVSIVVAKVRPRRLLEWAIIAWAAVIVDVLVLAVSCTDPDVAWDAYVVAVLVGLPGMLGLLVGLGGLTLLSAILSAVWPRGR